MDTDINIPFQTLLIDLALLTVFVLDIMVIVLGKHVEKNHSNRSVFTRTALTIASTILIAWAIYSLNWNSVVSLLSVFVLVLLASLAIMLSIPESWLRRVRLA